MSESGQRSRVIRALRPLHAIPVENPVLPGTPDVNYIEGWIELKWLRRWPKSIGTVTKIDHYTVQQRNWLRRRFNRGGNAWLLLQVQKEWLLFTGRDAADYVGKLTRPGLYTVCRARWDRGLKDKELRRCLQRDWEVDLLAGEWNGYPMVNGCSSTADDVAKLRQQLLDATGSPMPSTPYGSAT